MQKEKIKRPLGFASGCLFQTHDPIDPETISAILATGATAIELSPQDLEDLLSLRSDDEIYGPLLSSFDYFSIHPRKSLFRDPADRKAAFELLAWLQDEYGCVNVVIHPDQLDDLAVLADAPFPVLLENMDARSSRYTNVAGMKEAFKVLPEARFCLDLNHCYTHDKSHTLARELLKNFADRLAEIHLSGFESFHEPLCATGQTDLINLIPKGDVPVIIESGCTSLEILGSEMLYVSRELGRAGI